MRFTFKAVFMGLCCLGLSTTGMAEMTGMTGMTGMTMPPQGCQNMSTGDICAFPAANQNGSCVGGCSQITVSSASIATCPSQATATSGAATDWCSPSCTMMNQMAAQAETSCASSCPLLCTVPAGAVGSKCKIPGGAVAVSNVGKTYCASMGMQQCSMLDSMTASSANMLPNCNANCNVACTANVGNANCATPAHTLSANHAYTMGYFCTSPKITNTGGGGGGGGGLHSGDPCYTTSNSGQACSSCPNGYYRSMGGGSCK